MDFRFSRKAIIKAQERQDDMQDMGITCARCGEHCKSPREGIDWFAIPFVPIEQGGKSGENCVIVCPKCYEEIGQDGTKEIPSTALPHFKGKGWFRKHLGLG